MVSKKEKTHKNKWVSGKTKLKPKKFTYPIMSIVFNLYFYRVEEKNTKGYGHKPNSNFIYIIFYFKKSKLKN